MQAVNLLPRDLVSSERSRLNLPLLGAGMVPILALGLVVHGYGAAHGQVDTAISELSVLNAQVAEIAPAKVRSAQEQAVANAATNQLAAQREARLTALQAALATSPPVDTFLDQIARIVPNNVWLTTMSATETGTPAFAIGGFTYSEDGVAQLLAHLQLLPTLSAVKLASATQTSVGVKTLIQFQIAATPVMPTPAVAPVVPGAAPTTTTATSTTAGGTTAAP